VGKPDLDVQPRRSAGLRVAPHPQVSGKTSDIRCAPSTLFSGISTDLFVLHERKTTLKGRRFQNRDSENITNPTNSLCTCSG
jgi:hypothetical protein